MTLSQASNPECEAISNLMTTYAHYKEKSYPEHLRPFQQDILIALLERMDRLSDGGEDHGISKI